MNDLKYTSPEPFIVDLGALCSFLSLEASTSWLLLDSLQCSTCQNIVICHNRIFQTTTAVQTLQQHLYGIPQEKK
jgi:hypothetical protein